MGVWHRLEDGSIEIRENFDIKPFRTEDDRYRFILAMCEAEGEGKSTKLVATVSAMPVGITRNKTFYPADELEKSIPSWTEPYPCPVIKDHNEYEVDGIVGRINKAYVAKDGATDALWFEVSILDPEAQRKVADGTWAQVSIGTRVESATCSVCGTDLAKEGWCGHERGDYYLRDENDPNSVVMCYLTMGAISGREVSFVTTPSAATAGVRSANMVAAETVVDEPRHYDGMILAMANESDAETLRMVEAYHNGSPASNGEATVPSSEKEESMPPKVDKTKEAEVVETEVLSDASIEGEEAPEVPETEAVEADGPAVEDEGAEEPVTEDEPEAPAEETSEESMEEEAADPVTSDSVEDVEAADEADEPAEEEVTPEVSEREELLSRIATLEATVLSLKAQVYVESGLRDGILVGEHDALVEMHSTMTESSLDELIDVVATRRSRVSASEDIMKNRVQSPVLRVNDDDKADEQNNDDVIVSVKTKEGSHAVTVTEDRTKVVITPKIN
jgi:hypothetical protein